MGPDQHPQRFLPTPVKPRRGVAHVTATSQPLPGRLSAARPDTPPTCPFCHLRFSHTTELIDHVTRDHPQRGVQPNSDRLVGVGTER